MSTQEVFPGERIKEIALKKSTRTMDQAGKSLDRLLDTTPQDQTLLIGSLRELYVRAAVSVSVLSHDSVKLPPKKDD